MTQKGQSSLVDEASYCEIVDIDGAITAVEELRASRRNQSPPQLKLIEACN
jgi:hypothetical protein